MDCSVCPAGAACAAASTEPSTCAPGSYSNSSGLSICEPCPAGQYCPSSPLQSLEACYAGHFCPEGSPLPLPCAAGTFSPATELTNASECSDCPAGSYCSLGSVAPAPCSPGSFTATSRASVCSLCAAGQYQPNIGAVECIFCDAGSHCAEGASTPSPCPAGSFRTDVGAAVTDDCSPCPAGSACVAGSAQATLCEPGTIAAETGAGICDACAAGSYQPLSGETECIDCLAGSYCLERATGTTLCGPGSFTPAAGFAACEACAGGTYQPASGETACIACPAGYSCATGASAPLPDTPDQATLAEGFEQSCPPGQQEIGGQCEPCQRGHYCRGGVAFLCPLNTWLNATGATNQTACLPCPAGTTAVGGYQVMVTPGYFLASPASGRPAYKCSTNYNAACLGGLERFGDDSCATGHTGLLCGRCENGTLQHRRRADSPPNTNTRADPVELLRDVDSQDITVVAANAYHASSVCRAVRRQTLLFSSLR